MRPRLVAVLLLAAPLPIPAARAADQEVRTIPARPGVTQSLSCYSGAEDIVKALERAPIKELMAFAGGSPAISSSCEAKAAHGYLGIESPVVPAIGAWIRAHRPRPRLRRPRAGSAGCGGCGAGCRAPAPARS
jgi:hypothetical protein